MPGAKMSVPPAAEPGDHELVRRALAREPDVFRTIMTRYNQRLYRLARAILRDDAEAEDALQEAWLRAFSRLESFRGDSALATWLSRIVINEALGRLRKKRRRATTVVHGCCMATCSWSGSCVRSAMHGAAACA